MNSCFAFQLQLPQQTDYCTPDKLFALFLEKLFKKVRFENPEKSPPVLILNFGKYQMGVPVGKLIKSDAEQNIFSIQLAGHVFGQKWEISVKKGDEIGSLVLLEEDTDTRIVTVRMDLPQHRNIRDQSTAYLYTLFKNRVKKKSNWTQGDAPLLILNLSDGEINYQMGLPVKKGSFHLQEKKGKEIGFRAEIDCEILGSTWILNVLRNGQAYLEKIPK